MIETGREYYEVIDLYRRIGLAVVVDKNTGIVVNVKPAAGRYMIGQRLDAVLAKDGGRRYSVKKVVLVPRFGPEVIH